MAETKKLAVAFDPLRPQKKSNDFLIPAQHDGSIVFRRLKSGNLELLGMIVYIGRTITENDLLAKAVDSGMAINSVETTLSHFRRYLDQLQAFKIGNVIRIEPHPDND